MNTLKSHGALGRIRTAHGGSNEKHCELWFKQRISSDLVNIHGTLCSKLRFPVAFERFRINVWSWELGKSDPESRGAIDLKCAAYMVTKRPYCSFCSLPTFSWSFELKFVGGSLETTRKNLRHVNLCLTSSWAATT